MKTMVISCLEPQHLTNCLRALRLWIKKEDIYVINNAYEPNKISTIESISRSSGVNVIRPEYVEGEARTKKFIHKITNDFARMFPKELILKLDEDVIFVSEKRVPQVDKGVFYFPLATINNYTTKVFAKELWPDIYKKCKVHDWMWHKEKPYDIKKQLFELVYQSDPKKLIEFTHMNDIQESITAKNCESKILMKERGISTHTVFFWAKDHIDNFGDEFENQEIHFYNMVKKGKFKYVVDYGMFCHHVNYHSVRDLVQGRKDLVTKFHEGIFSYYEITPSRSKSSRGVNVCVGSGWYADLQGAVRGKNTLAPQLFEASFMKEIFIPRIRRGLNPKAIHLYVSECEVPPNPMPEGVEVVRGKRNAKRNTTPGRKPYEIGAAHDWGTAFMLGAMFAFCNHMDYFFVEQDCLIHNFKRAYKIAKEMKAPMIYGFGDLNSFKPGWAEPSLTFVSYEFLPEFIERMMQGRWHEWNAGFDRFKNPEKQFHNTFADVAEYWPFGSGMKRPIPWDSEVYFAQRFDRPNYEKFMAHNVLEKVNG